MQLSLSAWGTPFPSLALVECDVHSQESCTLPELGHSTSELPERGVKGHLVPQPRTPRCKNLLEFPAKDRWDPDPAHSCSHPYSPPIPEVPAQTELTDPRSSLNQRQSPASLKEERQGQSGTQGEFESGHISPTMTTILSQQATFQLRSLKPSTEAKAEKASDTVH